MAVLTAVAPEHESFVAAVTSTGTVTIRKSVYALNDDEVTQYRLAVARMAAISAQAPSEQRGYQWIAGVHGLPQQYCHRNQPAFASWHRPFIQQYEQRLQDVVPGAFVPTGTGRRAARKAKAFPRSSWMRPGRTSTRATKSPTRSSRNRRRSSHAETPRANPPILQG